MDAVPHGGDPTRYAMTAEAIAKALGGRKTGGSWMARCPAHDDREPSLSLTTGREGRLLVRCHAGCPQEAVVAAMLGLSQYSPSPATWHSLGVGTCPGGQAWLSGALSAGLPILAADVVGYCRLMGADEEGTLATLLTGFDRL